MKPLRVVGAALIGDGRVLAALRGPGMSDAGCWEFPGGKVEPGEDDATALVRELREELGIETEVGAPLGAARVGAVELHLYVARVRDGAPEAREHAQLRWVDARSIGTLLWAPADRPFLDAVAARLGAS